MVMGNPEHEAASFAAPREESRAADRDQLDAAGEEEMPPEPPTAKRARSESESSLAGGDRLSDLPDGLLHAVLSFLPAPQMVRTSVLSRRWVDLWRTAPCVNADMAEFGITSLSFHRNLEQRWSKFEAFTTSLLLLRSAAASLDKFRLCAPGRFPQDVDRWVRHAIECCPRVLEVHIWIPPAVVFPSPLLGANSHRLKRLQLCVVCLDGQFAELIRSGCPVLEKLELHGCTQTFHEISSRKLKSLIVMTCGDLAGDAVVIAAPPS
ncbi:hypothetical protein ACP70R_011638 [Stipagrostis hirtigluma subsp. patula]